MCENIWKKKSNERIHSVHGSGAVLPIFPPISAERSLKSTGWTSPSLDHTLKLENNVILGSSLVPAFSILWLLCIGACFFYRGMPWTIFCQSIWIEPGL